MTGGKHTGDQPGSMWITVTLLADASNAEALSDALLDAGALSVDVEDADAGTPDETPQFGEPGLPVAVELWAAFSGCMRCSTRRPTWLARWPRQRRRLVWHRPAGHHLVLDEQNWVRITQAQFEPIRVSSRLWIVPSWHEQPDPAAINITLDPGMAFGTGSHPTTRLCLEWLDETLQVAGGETVVDYGCGSGILAVAAAKLGADRVTGTDIDPHALDAARYNAQRNGAALELLHSRENIDHQADIVVANILANPLTVLAPLLCGLTRTGGRIALSGILASQAQQVIDAYAPLIALQVGARATAGCAWREAGADALPLLRNAFSRHSRSNSSCAPDACAAANASMLFNALDVLIEEPMRNGHCKTRIAATRAHSPEPRACIPAGDHRRNRRHRQRRLLKAPTCPHAVPSRQGANRSRRNQSSSHAEGKAFTESPETDGAAPETAAGTGDTRRRIPRSNQHRPGTAQSEFRRSDPPGETARLGRQLR
jgi:ribosomal protein L11 methyltransferase